MKSIKEKANEYAKEYLFSTLPQKAPNVHFEAGANYVLDAIEECFNPKDDIVKQWGAIATLVEQLKSNQ